MEIDADRERKRIEHEVAEGKHAPKLGAESLKMALLEFVKHAGGIHCSRVHCDRIQDNV